MARWCHGMGGCGLVAGREISRILSDLVSGFLEQGKGHGIVDGVAGGANHMFGRGIIDRAVVAQLVVEAAQFGVLRAGWGGVNAIH